jgi:hypothetical protein
MLAGGGGTTAGMVITDAVACRATATPYRSCGLTGRGTQHGTGGTCDAVTIGGTLRQASVALWGSVRVAAP